MTTHKPCDSTDPGSFNNSVAGQQAVLETVARVKSKRNESKEEKLISDLVVVIVSATCGGIAFACAGQPVITGYLLAGSVIGPGGLSFVNELVQDCAVGLLFALLSILGGTSGILEGMLSMTKMLATLVIFLAVLSIFSRTCIPWFFNLMISLSSQTNELYQLASVAFCLIVASVSSTAL
ncbi:hypothetical protein L1987_53982 [Smallanthus sonchifolius]|uniref:Uncharacterized protein n=1 Tax=Smallanthus sonchifolius TaxID=185202 RepID=A0ACB9E5K8_9ASTR|nr:hypothetical protein L1987_53982 [Smallanthus sonchifolius]